MKKTVRVLSVLILLALVCTLAVPAVAYDEFDFDTAIEGYEKGPHNYETLWVGQQYEHHASIWPQNGGRTYSSDTDVVTVDANGIVTAVGEGTAYVAYVGVTGMYQLVRYDVTEKLPVMEAVGGSSGLQGAMESLLALLGIGTASVAAVMAGLGMVLAILFASVFFGILAYLIISMLRLSSNSMKEKVLPPLVETENTVKTPTGVATRCTKCGADLEGGAFCSECGTPAQIKCTYTVPIKKRMTAQKFEKELNAWLAENPYIYNCRIKLDTSAWLFIPTVQYKFFVKSATVEYCVSDKPQKRRYGFAFLYKFWLFGPFGYSNEKQLEEWKENNPDCQVISTKGGRIQHFGTRSGIFAQYYNHVLFKK